MEDASLLDNQMIFADRHLRRVTQRESLAVAQEPAVGISFRTPLQPAFAQPLQASRDFFQPLPSAAICLPLSCWPAASSQDCASHCFCQRRICRRILARSARNLATVSTRSREALAATRVESMATCPSRPIPSDRANSTTCVNRSFRARACRVRNWFSVQKSGPAPARVACFMVTLSYDAFPKPTPHRRTYMIIRLITFVLLSASFLAAEDAYDYRVLATKKTSTMEKELNEAADAGYRIEKVMGGKTGFGGSEVVVVMSKSKTSTKKGRYAYKLLAASRTSTMQKELQEGGNEGFLYKDQTVFGSMFGGDEVVVILELDRENRSKARYEYKLLATNRTSTMQRELQEAGEAGFKFLGVTVSKTRFGGREVVSILLKEVME